MNGIARARVFSGMWIADCERQDCNNAEKLLPRQPIFHCSNCHWEGIVEWPAEVDEIWAVLERRPVPQTRNWFPQGHRLAGNVPHGQTVLDLIAENHEHGVN